MDMTLSQLQSTKSRRNRWLLGTALLIAALALIALFIAAQSANRAATTAAAANTISASVLEERYGLRVNLIAKTAAGGLVDVRLKVLDAAKAKALLSDPKNFPTLKVAGSDTVLATSEDMQLQALQALDGGLVAILYSNRGSIVQPNAAVSVNFGDVQLEPIAAK